MAVDLAKAKIGLDPDDDVVLIPYPAPGTLREQIDTLLRRVAASVAPRLPLPRVAKGLGDWLVELPDGTPLLIPPFVVEIR